METITIVAHQRNNHGRYYAKNRGRCFTDFEGVNCRAFQSGAGLLPIPSKYFSNTPSPVSKRSSYSPKTPSPYVNENRKGSKKAVKSSPFPPIPFKIDLENTDIDFGFSERWAGPAYSNSPPPSSLPIPKFTVRPKRTKSLELPRLTPDVNFKPLSNSAPASPKGERSCHSSFSLSDCGDSATKTFSARYLADSDDSATKTLRRILNLDITDE